MDVGQVVDAWWAKKGRAKFVAMVEEAAKDSKVQLILKEGQPSRLEGRVDPNVAEILTT